MKAGDRVRCVDSPDPIWSDCAGHYGIVKNAVPGADDGFGQWVAVWFETLGDTFGIPTVFLRNTTDPT